ncbi:MAG: D-alanine--D-alanine ligase family protein [Angelakisella sp.]|nr:D-alanine--D-alanine ligase family protein [Angelakisella sp.]
MSNKTMVAVLFGGVSSEHEVSRLSVTSVLANIDRTRYDTIAVGITKDGRWLRFDGDEALIAGGQWEKDSQHLCPCVLSPDTSHHGLLVLEQDGWRTVHIDVVFPVLHGKNGEDGTIQGLLEMAGLPYVGCGVAASANCMDKDIAKIILAAAGIPVAKWITVPAEEFYDLDAVDTAIAERLGYPVFVKPANAGSSVGVSKAANKAELRTALYEAFKEDRKVIIEETLKGAEVECAVMGNYQPKASSVIGEIVPKRDLYDYEGKYVDGSTDLYIPARISTEQTDLVRAMAVRAYTLLGCTGLSRVDFFACPDGKSVVLNELNTLPGFTNISMYPKLFMASGLTYPQIIDKLIQLGIDCKKEHIEF